MNVLAMTKPIPELLNISISLLQKYGIVVELS